MKAENTRKGVYHDVAFFVEVWPRFSSLSKRPKSSLMVNFLAQHPVLSFFIRKSPGHSKLGRSRKGP